jgi:hypothetical protein
MRNSSFGCREYVGLATGLAPTLAMAIGVSGAMEPNRQNEAKWKKTVIST